MAVNYVTKTHGSTSYDMVLHIEKDTYTVIRIKHKTSRKLVPVYAQWNPNPIYFARGATQVIGEFELVEEDDNGTTLELPGIDDITNKKPKIVLTAANEFGDVSKMSFYEINITQIMNNIYTFDHAVILPWKKEVNAEDLLKPKEEDHTGMIQGYNGEWKWL